MEEHERAPLLLQLKRKRILFVGEVLAVEERDDLRLAFHDRVEILREIPV